jgi:ligand-binding sensor domain-containing protein
LWIATRNGLSNFNPETKIFRNFRKDPSGSGSISHNFILELVEDGYGNIWIGGRGGLDRYNLKKQKFFNYKMYPENPNDIALNGIMSLFIKNEVLWI